jgi:hypothetical protein
MSDKDNAASAGTVSNSELIEPLGLNEGLTIGNSHAGIKLILPLYVQWTPQDDITAYEVAQLMPLITAQRPIMPSMLPPDPKLLPHIKIHDPNENEITGAKRPS